VDALVRELSEEVGDRFQVRRPLACVENSYSSHRASFHQVCIIYAVEWLGGSRVAAREGVGEVLLWVPRAEVTQIDLRPALLKPYILDPPPHLVLITHRDTRDT
jgi:hypothetical protein